MSLLLNIQRDITFRKAEQSDIEYLLWLRNATMNQHLVNSGIYATQEDHLARIQHQFDYANIIQLDRKQIGLFKFFEKETTAEIIQIQIATEYQGKGIGREILTAVIENAHSKNISVILSVLKYNKVKNLYIELGFNIIEENSSSYRMIYNTRN